MGMQKVRFVGLNRDVWLPDDIEVIIDIVPSWRTNIRSNQPFSGQTKTTWHDTGNPNSDAWAERNWLHSGADGQYVGYNFAYDAKRIIQLTPLNEITWHAGTPEGNMYSWGAEQTLATDWDGCLRVGAALHGGLCAAMGWNPDVAVVKHQVWYGKWCPGQILNRGIWPIVQQMIRDATARAKAAASGSQVVDTVTINVGDTFAPIKDTGVRKGYGTSQPVVYWIGTNNQGTRIQGDPQDANGLTWINVYVEGKGSGWAVLGDLKKVASPAPVATFDGTKDVVINGNLYHASKRTVTSLDGLNERQWASTDSQILKTYSAGVKIPVLGWVVGEAVNNENRWWVRALDGGRLWVGGTVEKP